MASSRGQIEERDAILYGQATWLRTLRCQQLPLPSTLTFSSLRAFSTCFIVATAACGGAVILHEALGDEEADPAVVTLAIVNRGGRDPEEIPVSSAIGTGSAKWFWHSQCQTLSSEKGSCVCPPPEWGLGTVSATWHCECLALFQLAAPDGHLLR